MNCFQIIASTLAHWICIPSIQSPFHSASIEIKIEMEIEIEIEMWRGGERNVEIR
jgi:hypothetical protein